MNARFRLENRRKHHVLAFEFRGASYRAGFSFFPSGALAEVFLSAAKPNSAADIAANDSAILCSLCLQNGIPLQQIRHSLLKSDDADAAGPLAHALDIIDAASYAR